MRTLWVAGLAILLSGCAGGVSRQEVAQRLGDQYNGKPVDNLVVEFGPPSSLFKMNSGETSYVWQLDSSTNAYVTVNGANASGSSSTTFCKVSVIASPSGIVTRLTTEDQVGSNGLISRATGTDMVGSMCARRLGMKRSS
ncbi:hypothetical protein FNL56_16270 [Tardiphaga sp. vice304]|nr:hypothetical protein FNL56_16270 [Tardiphaga sp. vice304]